MLTILIDVLEGNCSGQTEASWTRAVISVSSLYNSVPVCQWKGAISEVAKGHTMLVYSRLLKALTC